MGWFVEAQGPDLLVYVGSVWADQVMSFKIGMPPRGRGGSMKDKDDV